MTDPAEARKRRKEIMQSQRGDGEEDVTAAAAAPAKAVAATPDKKPPKKRKVTADDDSAAASATSKAAKAAAKQDAEDKKKTQIRYDPEVPMNKEQLAAWRREARRVRNRESAAASRQRIRSRISELEDEVGQWKSKYSEAVQRLEALEAAMATRPEVLAAAAAVQAAQGGTK
ncbi:MAG: hypothetical protein SGILL_001387 [Bacillariaceae sp.]